MFWLVTLAIMLSLLVFGLWIGRGHLPSGRLGRLARIGRMSAALSASWLGAKVRRVFASRAGRARIDEAQREAVAKRVTATMGSMKGAFMKLGQMMSFISDSVPEHLRTQLKQLQSDAPPMEFALVRDTVERELGGTLERLFSRFDEKPLASASIGQVHRARLPTGEDVVVKVQYPGVADAIRSDLANAALLQQMMRAVYPAHDPKPVIEELRGRIFEEFDYTNELKNLDEFGALYAGHPFIVIPRGYPSHSTSKVLTLEFVEGRRFDEVLADPPEQRSRYAEIVYRFVFGTILRHQLFNGDPHPGNYLFQEDRVVFLDFGCVKRFPDEMARNWSGLVKSHFDGDRDAFRAFLVALQFIKTESPLDADRLYRYFQLFYEPFRFDKEFVFTRDYISSTFRQVFSPDGEFEGMSKQLNMPGDFVFVNRIQWGVLSILGQLASRANYHRIHREYLFGDPPATALGELDAAYQGQRRNDNRASGAGHSRDSP